MPSRRSFDNSGGPQRVDGRLRRPASGASHGPGELDGSSDPSERVGEMSQTRKPSPSGWSSRHRAREFALRMLYQWDLTQSSGLEIMSRFWEGEPFEFDDPVDSEQLLKHLQEQLPDTEIELEPSKARKAARTEDEEEGSWYSQEERLYAESLFRGVLSRRENLDTRLEQCSTRWRLSRMPPVDRNILRLGAYELSGPDEVPWSVVINEAIELAKAYSTSESGAFINGVLDKLARTLEDELRAQAKSTSTQK